MSYSCTVCRLFSHVSWERERRQVCAQSGAWQSYFCSIAGFAVRVHIGKGARRDSVSDLTGSPSPCFRGQKCKPVSLLNREAGYYGSDMCTRRAANLRRHFIAVY